jgi:hypothetical protein
MAGRSRRRFLGCGKIDWSQPMVYMKFRAHAEALGEFQGYPRIRLSIVPWCDRADFVESNDAMCTPYLNEITRMRSELDCTHTSKKPVTIMGDEPKEKRANREQDSVIEINLQDAVGQRKPKGQRSSISVLDPAIFISRSRKTLDLPNRKKKNPTEQYHNQPQNKHDLEYLHIRVAFTLEVAISNFEHP